MLEQAAGLDPCVNDTDHDGCPDSAEYYAGGCDGVILLQEPCWGEPASSEVHVTLPSDRGPWRDVSVRASGAEGWAVLQIELLDDPDAGATGGDSFGPVQPGATLAYRVTANEATGDQALRARIEIVGDGEVLTEQRVIIIPAFSCPIPV
jgi:hypothetical protein